MCPVFGAERSAVGLGYGRGIGEEGNVYILSESLVIDGVDFHHRLLSSSTHCWHCAEAQLIIWLLYLTELSAYHDHHGFNSNQRCQRRYKSTRYRCQRLFDSIHPLSHQFLRPKDPRSRPRRLRLSLQAHP